MEASGKDPTYWLALTKLRPPLPRSDFIARPHLVQALRGAVLSSRLTLVSAPAGYGKSTLLAALRGSDATFPLAWLSIEAEDGDLARFLTAVVLALRQLYPDCGSRVLDLLGSPTITSPSPHDIVAALVNDVLDAVTQPTVLVLDDLHLVSDLAVHTALDSFLEKMPPLLHLAVATRHDPPLGLDRMRGRGQLAELRLIDLRFTLEETTEVLNDRLQLSLGEEDLARLYAQVEGWPAGIRLASNSLSRISAQYSRSAFISDLASEDRSLFGYLASEVLDREAPAVRRFLLETSILSELTPGLCNAVAGRKDAAAVLAHLYRNNVFVTAINVQPMTLRYHALFAEFLQGRLRTELPRRVSVLHRLAALAAPSPSRAIGHYVSGGLWEEAATAITQVAGSMLHDNLASIPDAWLRAIPESLRVKYPRLLLLDGVSLFQRGDHAPARACFEKAFSALQATTDNEGASEASRCLAACMFVQADFERADGIVKQALSHSIPPPQRAQLLMMRSWIALLQRRWEEAIADLFAALEEVEAAGTSEAFAALALHFRLDLVALPGALDRVERFLERATRFVRSKPTLFDSAIHDLSTFVHLSRGRLKMAAETGEQAVRIIRDLGGYPLLGLQAAGFGSLAYLAQGEYDGAERLLAFVMDRLSAIPLGKVYMAAPLYNEAKIWLARGNLQMARRTADKMWSAATETESTEAATLRWKLRGQLAMASHRYAQAESALKEAAQLEEKMPGALLFGRTRVLLARLAYDRERPTDALAELEPVLAECERQDTPGVILLDGSTAAPVLRLAVRRGVHATFAERVLSLVPPGSERVRVAVPETGSILSRRETDVLGLLVSGARNRTIAEQLVIDETTVKCHVSSILRKLGVSSRTQAAARASDLGLPGARPGVLSTG